MACPIGKSCPSCGGDALEVTATGDRTHRYICGAGCGHQWNEPFSAPARAMHRMADSVEQAAESFERFAEAYQAANEAENRALLAQVYGCPVGLVDDVIRVRLSGEQEAAAST